MAKRPKTSRKMSAPRAGSRAGDTRRVPFLENLRSSFSALAATLAFISSALGVLVVYATNKGAFSDLLDDYYKYVYSDAEWTGAFNNFPEGSLDIASMNLSDTDVEIIIAAKHGKIGGAMAGKPVCKYGLPFDFILIEGETAFLGTKADVRAYDFVGGDKKILAEFSLRLDGVVLDVIPKTQHGMFGGAPLRIARHPDRTSDQAMDTLRGFCAR